MSFQLFEPLLCMDFGDFQQAVEKVLRRPVFTHEFAFMDNLRKEFLGDRTAPKLPEIIAMIPRHKRLLLFSEQGEER